MLPPYSVLMSVYIKEKTEYLSLSIESILNQTIQPNEIVIVKDGPLTKELNECLEKFKNDNCNIKIIDLSKNVGLGKALNEGLLECKNEWVFRMDTDDFAASNRCEEQLNYALKNDLDLVGSDVYEFDNDVTHINVYKEMPKTNEEIIKYSKKRNPFNHPTVLFKKSIINKVGGYQDVPNFEDYDLWVRVIISGGKCGNISKPLVYMRGNKNMYKRRGGINYIKKILNFRLRLYRYNYISFVNFLLTTCIQSIIAILPNNFRIRFYKMFLRTSKF